MAGIPSDSPAPRPAQLTATHTAQVGLLGAAAACSVTTGNHTARKSPAKVEENDMVRGEFSPEGQAECRLIFNLILAK